MAAALQNLNLTRPDPAAWAAGAEWSDFSTDSAAPRASIVGPSNHRPAPPSPAPPPRATRLHVSNLPFCFRYAELARLFSTYGLVIDAEIIFNEKGSKGFGFTALRIAAQAA
jgi:hypothetical protein